MQKCLPRLQFMRCMRRRAARNLKQRSDSLKVTTERISSGDKEIIIDAKKTTVHHSSSNIGTFHSFNFRDDVVQGLESMKIVEPTVIQMLSIPLITEKKSNIFCAAQTGSGKTIVYVAPIIHNLKEDEDKGFIKRLSRPTALIIAPARELAMQILQQFKMMSHYAPLRSLGLIGQKQKKWTRDYSKGVVDVVVGTPDTVLKYIRKGFVNLSDLRYLVLDEADTLMDDNFYHVTTQLLEICQLEERSMTSPKSSIQCILTSATLPSKGVLNNYRNYIPELEICQSNLHKVLPNVKHTFVKTQLQKKIDHVILKLNRFLKKDSSKCLVFCNTSKSCNWLSLQFDKNDITHSKLHGNMNPKVRFQDFEDFMYGSNRILVCTDIASRGIDTTDVTLVINFDCPFSTTDYIHRSGRTGRAKQVYDCTAEVLTYITKNSEVNFAKTVQNAADKNEALTNVSQKRTSAKERYLKGLEEYNRLKKSNKNIVRNKLD